ncbi:MAG: GDSL-type esterase/lipase family protein [Rubrivivax sp.]|jgi:lysophospholipase L1-like esterase|nr:GDSL-type esterase/lipase family protein [Rubrivivax sp.]
MVEVPWQRPLRVLTYGDSNTWGFVTDAATGNPSRLPDAERWPGILQAALGSGVQVLVDAIPGRRTDRDAEAELPIVDSVSPSALNGLRHAEAAGLSQAPLDLVIVMLGTNDLAIVPQRPLDEIGEACARVAQALVRGATAFTPDRVPQVLLVSPPPLGGAGAASAEVPGWPAVWQASRDLAPALEGVARAQGLHAFDGGSATPTSGPDLVHLDADDHRRMGLALADRVRSLLPAR